MNRDYYNEYFKLEREHWWYRARLNILEGLISKLSKELQRPLQILNVGAATGHTSRALMQYGTVTSIEYDADVINYTKAQTGIDISQGDATDLGFNDGSFDIVCAFDVIEHIEDDSQAVLELKRVCKESGFVFVTVPAYMSLWGQHDVVNQHYRRYLRNELKGLFLTDGKICFASYFNTFLFIPIYIFRQCARMFPGLLSRKGAGSDFTVFQKSFMDKILYRIFLTEKLFLDHKISFPFGVSVLLIWQKDQTD